MVGLLVLGLWDESVEIDFNRSQRAADNANEKTNGEGDRDWDDGGILSRLLPVGSEKTGGAENLASGLSPNRQICREALERCTEDELLRVLDMLDHHVRHFSGVKLATRHSSSSHHSPTRKERRRSSLEHPPE